MQCKIEEKRKNKTLIAIKHIYKIMKNNAQAMLEYMALVSFAILLLSVILYSLMSYMIESTTQMNIDSAYKTVDIIKDKSDFVYVHGYPSKTEARITIPGNIERIDMSGNIIRMRLSIASHFGESYTDIYGVTRGNLTSNLQAICNPDCRPGDYILVIEHIKNNRIRISVK